MSKNSENKKGENSMNIRNENKNEKYHPVADNYLKMDCLMQLVRETATGRAIEIKNEDDLKEAVKFSLAVMGQDITVTDELIDIALHENMEKGDSRKVICISFSKWLDSTVINFVFTDKENPIQFDDLANTFISFAYVYNVGHPEFSEFRPVMYRNYIRKM